MPGWLLVELNAIFVPSGDHVGYQSAVILFCVRFLWLEPSAFITKKSAVFPFLKERKAISVPSGDHAAYPLPLDDEAPTDEMLVVSCAEGAGAYIEVFCVFTIDWEIVFTTGLRFIVDFLIILNQHVKFLKINKINKLRMVFGKVYQ